MTRLDALITLLTWAGVLAMAVLPILALVLIRSKRRSDGLADRNAAQLTTIATLQRQLDDARALRTLPSPALSVVLDAAKLLRSYQAHHAAEAARLLADAAKIDGKSAIATSNRRKTEEFAKDRAEKANRNASMADRLEAVLSGKLTGAWALVMDTRSRHGGSIDGAARCERPPLGWSCTRTPGHDGPCAAVPQGGE